MSMKLMNYDNYQNGYGSYRIPSADVSSLGKTDGTAKQDSASAAQPAAKENIPLTSDNINKASKTASLDSVSVTFNKNESFGYIGSDKDISKLDETGSVSGKQKDSLLNDYLYYVGSSAVNNSQTPKQSGEDGTVILKGRLMPQV
jgi:hypothetical protein